MTTPEASNTPPDSSDSGDSPQPSQPSPSGGIIGMLRKNMILIGIGAAAVVVIIVVVVLFTSGVFSGGGGAPADPEGFVLEDSSTVSVVNVSKILAAEEIPAQLDNFVPIAVPSITDDYDPIDWKDDWRDDWEDDEEDVGFILDEVEAIMVVGGSDSYSVITGSFLLGDLRDSLEDAGYEEDQYRGLEIWQDRGTAIGVLESGGKRVVIDGDVDDVQTVLRAIDRGQGFLEDDSVLKEALSNAGDSLTFNSDTACSSEFFSTSSLRGCEAGIETITGGDLDTTRITGSYVFSSDRRSESGESDLEDAIEDQDYYDVDLDDIGVSGLMVNYRATIFEN